MSAETENPTLKLDQPFRLAPDAPLSTPPNRSLNSLDQSSFEHVAKLCEQLLTCSKLSVDRWKDPLLHALRQLDSYLDQQTLQRLANANSAQARAALDVDKSGANGSKIGPRNRTVSAGWLYESRAREMGEGPDGKEEQVREERREVWRTAAMHLSSLLADEGGGDDVEGAEDDQRHLRDMSTMSSLSVDEAWLEVESMAKFPLLSLRMDTIETTLTSVNNGETTMGIWFESDRFQGVSLFGREELDLDDDDLKVVDRLGGTFRLTTTKKCLPHLERLVEFLAFAVISLRIEAVVLAEFGCPRPLPLSPSIPSPTFPQTDSASESGEPRKEEEAEEEANSSVLDPKVPGAYNFDDAEPDDDDWGFTKRSWRSSFSNRGVLAWMRLANPRAQLPQPLVNRSLRRSSTVPSNDPSPLTLRTVSTIQPRSLETPSPSPSPSRSPDGKRRKIANKLRGIRNQLRDKVGRTKQNITSPEASDEEGDDERDVSDRGAGNTGVLGLQIAGVDLKSSSWSTVWSTSGTQGKSVSSEGIKDDVSVAQTDVTAEDGEKPPPKRFEKVIEDLSRFILSTSPDVLYPPPHLLFRLRQQELEASLIPIPATPIQLPSTPPSPSPIPPPAIGDGLRSEYLNPRLSNVSKSSALQRAHALPSSHSLALNFAEGLPSHSNAFEAEERRTNNASTATRIGLDAKAGLASLMTNNSSLQGTIRHQAMQFLVQVVQRDAPLNSSPCEPFQWLSVDFFSTGTPISGSIPDSSIEGFVRRLVFRQNDSCSQCSRPHRDHLVNLLHYDEKVEIMFSSMSDADTPDEPETDPVLVSNRCNICQATSTPNRLTSIAGAFSFAKFVELMLYDPNFLPLPELCEHASTERNALVREFALGSTTLQLSRTSVALYELRLPTAVDPDVATNDTDDSPSGTVDSLDTLSTEIASFFNSVRAHTSSLRQHFSFPPPSPPASPPEGSPPIPSEPSIFDRQHVRSDSEQTIIDASRPVVEPRSISQIVEGEGGVEGTSIRAIELLRQLETLVDREEHACRDAVQDLSSQDLNLGRSTFETKAGSLKARLASWKEKHCGSTTARLNLEEPEYFSHDALALPIQSNVLLRPRELSSVLAVALSTPEFKDECQAVSAASSRRVTPSTPTFVPKSRQSSLRLPIPTFTSTEDVTSVLDPDDIAADFAKPSAFELVAKRKKPARSSGSVFRNLVRKKSGEITGPSTPTSECGSFTLDSKKKTIKDSVLTDFLKTKEAPPTSNRSTRAVPSIISGLATRREGSSLTTLSLTDEVLAQFSSSGSAAGTIRSKVAPSSATSLIFTDSSASSIIESDKDSVEDSAANPEDADDQLAPLATDLGSNSSRLFDGLRSGLDSLRSRTGTSSPRLGSPLEEGFAVSEHVKIKMTQGEKKYSVTAYFPRRFKDLRAKCGLSESLFIESLSRCTDLNPDGGKSSAIFLMTGNQRFILKELVTKFGYSELDSLLTFAPRLLDYQMQADRPSLLSKIFGIYTIKVQDLKTGEKKKQDLIVIDNLFHAQTISRQFDLKGIASRVAKPKPGEETKDGSTGWDSDWLEGSVRNQLLLYPHSRTLLLDSINNDVEFLSSNGNIDFSLLVGVDDTKRTLVVGLIDTLGIFNTLKVLESSAKKGIAKALAADSSSVTVCPPTEYARRFLSSMETYFVASPDKWSRAPGEKEPDPDPRLACPI